jgi:hypothetical protein
MPFAWSIPLIAPGLQFYAKFALAILAIWILWRFWRALRRYQRSKKPPKLHPNLEKYGVDQRELAAQRRELARKIVATSSTDRLVGYEMTEQIDAVFVEGFRSPADAIDALKAEAAQRGANAVINVKQERTAAGRCTASGDAVRAERTQPKQE